MSLFRSFVAVVIQIVVEASNIIGGMNNTVNLFCCHHITAFRIFEREGSAALVQKSKNQNNQNKIENTDTNGTQEKADNSSINQIVFLKCFFIQQVLFFQIWMNQVRKKMIVMMIAKIQHWIKHQKDTLK